MSPLLKDQDQKISTPTKVAPPSRAIKVSFLSKLSKKILLSKLKDVVDGKIILIENNEEYQFGKTTEYFPSAVSIKVNNPNFYSQIVFGGDLGASEAYMLGFWSVNDLTLLIRMMVRNRSVLSSLEGGLGKVLQPISKLIHFFRENTKVGSKKNIIAHYDLGNEFFASFLDKTMMYSCAVYEFENTSLYEASKIKNDRICQKLDLKPGDKLLEIGTGWGGFAVHAAKHYGCHVTTTTISPSQHEWAQKVIEEESLNDKVTLLQKDYRDLEGKFDKIVSIEMIEAVGHQYYDQFFEVCQNRLKDDGMLLMQAIVTDERLYKHARDSVDFIKRYIFPGSCIPSVGALEQASKKKSEFSLFHIEDITQHYTLTLKTWRENFLKNVKDLDQVKDDKAFIRMWEYYFSYCEGGFAERSIMDQQILWVKPKCKRQPIHNLKPFQ